MSNTDNNSSEGRSVWACGGRDAPSPDETRLGDEKGHLPTCLQVRVTGADHRAQVPSRPLCLAPMELQQEIGDVVPELMDAGGPLKV